jgi:Tol biopolymer transport system component
MKQIVFAFALASILAVPSQGVAQLPRPGIECSCSRTGPYVAPGRATIAWNALASPRGRYTVEPWPGRLGLTVRQQGEEVVNEGPYGQEIGWGFSPDEQRLVIHTTRPGQPGIPAQHSAWLHDLTAPSRTPWSFQSAVREAVSVFSPHGRYLLHVAQNPDQRTRLTLVDAATLAEVGDGWNFTGVPAPGNEGQTLGLAAWGFSPDDADASFLYGYNSATGVRLNLVNLTRGRRVIEEWLIQTTAEWRFSPCGDLLAVVRFPYLSPADVWLERTLDGSHLVAGYNVPGYGGLTSAADGQYAYSGAGQTRLTTHVASTVCEGLVPEAPYWPANAKLTARNLKPASVQLTRPAARSDGGPIVLYEIRTTQPVEAVVATLQGNDPPDVTVTGLEPQTEYTFAIWAKNLSELWTAEAVTVTVTTPKANAAPEWPSGARLVAENLEETRLTLTWPAAVDDVAVTQYRLSRDQEVLATVSGQQRTYDVSGLVIGQRYEFVVQAGDAQDQWSTDGPRLRIATEDESPPTWPSPVVFRARERGLTRLVLEWTPAVDNVEVSLYRLFLEAGGRSFLFTEVAGDSTNATLACLAPHRTYAFRLEAGDEAGNWSTDGPQTSASTSSGPLDCLETLEVVSVNSQEQLAEGTPPPGDTWDPWFNADSERPALSADGRFVAFESIAINLVPGDDNNTRITVYESGGYYSHTQTWFSDIFVRDRLAGTTERVSLSASGAPIAVGRSCWEPAISGDGQCVAFTSSAPDLVHFDENNAWDVFLRDRTQRTTHRVSRPTTGGEANGRSHSPALSHDATFVAFVSEAPNLVPNDTNGAADIFVLDRAATQLTRISVSTDGTQANGRSWLPSISADGRFIAFASEASNLVPDDTNQQADAFVHDRETGLTTRVSVSSTGAQANHGSCRTHPLYPRDTRPAISADGRFVAFDSAASNLVPGDTNQDPDVFVHDRQTGETTRVSVASDGTQAETPAYAPGRGFAASQEPALSGDGRFVVFASKATSLVPEKRSITTDVFLHDRQTGVTRRLSACPCDEGGPLEPNIGSNHSALSADGRVIAFDSEATNLKPGLIDPNWSSDVFVFVQDPGPLDSDGDGTPDAEEQGPAGDDPLYDGNGDGIPDRWQDNVSARRSADGRHYFHAQLPRADSAIRLLPLDPPDPGLLPPGVVLPFGAFALEAWSAVEPGGDLIVELQFPEGVPFNAYYKYGGLPDDPTPRWYEFMFDGVTGAEIEAHRVRLHFRDGDRGDSDLTPDRNLLDPGGPAQVGTTLPPQFEVSPATLNFGERTASLVLELGNAGERPLVWAVQPDLPSWLVVIPDRGALEPGQGMAAEVFILRDGLPAGPLTHRLVVRSGGGSQAIAVEAVAPLALAGRAEWVGPCLTFQWRSEPGARYRVQATRSLTAPAWQDVSELLWATDVLTTWTDCPDNPDGRFYRVVGFGQEAVSGP